MLNDEIIKNMEINNLSKYACPYSKAERLFLEEDNDIRPTFYRDIDRILYSLSYTRFLDKTQVFTHKKNDHITRRMTHVQFVSKIARTIGRALNLNEDLIEAASLGHDLGHTPFGHVGEHYLNEISLKHGCGYFNHNIQSVRLLMNIENHGEGLNISIPVLDAIMCHNGEFALGKYIPSKKSKKEFLEEYNNSYKDRELLLKLKPMTLEGCVVRISDLIAYLGRDIEDAVRLNIISFEDIPKNIKDTLGSSNREIVNTIILDVIKNSYNKNYIELSDNIFTSIKELKDFNYKYIYANAYTKKEKEEIKEMLETLFNKYIEDIKNNNNNSKIVNSYLKKMNSNYKDNNSTERIVIDYISGMTDFYIKEEYLKLKETSC